MSMAYTAPTSVPLSSSSLGKLTTNQRQEMGDVLRAPLNGREVLIPVTSKAFVIGSLQPEKLPDGNEIVHVRQGKEFLSLSRKDALTFIQTDIHKVKTTSKSKRTADPTNNTATKQQTDAKPTIIESPQKPSVFDSSLEVQPGLPFIEIKEEFNKDGQLLRSEKVNITKQMELMKEKLTPNTSESKEDQISQEDEKNEEFHQDEIKPKKVVSDAEYQAISARLDLLARLEEEAEAKAESNVKSSLKLQSKGWSKGFLNQKPKQKKKPPQPPKSNAGATQKQRATTKAVSFQEEKNQIKEIPHRTTPQQNSSQPTRGQFNPFDSTVFSGVIKERPRTKIKTSQLQIKEKQTKPGKTSRFSQEQSASRKSASKDDKTTPKKKLSKFAQDRQGL